MKKFIGKTMAGKVVSVHMGNNEDLSKDTQALLTAEIGGFAGDKHHGFTRKAWKVDWQLAGTVRRNERQWSGGEDHNAKPLASHRLRAGFR